MYTPSRAPTINNPDDLRKWVEEEFVRLSQQLQLNDIVQFQVLYKEPDRLTDGMLVFADGTSWNPGSGRGLYERRASNWQKL